MLEELTKFITQHALFNHNHKLLVAVSGGVDSMVLLRLLIDANFKHLGVAHCNFNLREQDSINDALLVKETAKALKLPFYEASFDTQAYAKTHGISIEMAARSLRYNFFESIQQTRGYHFILTAHHQDDSIETFFLNLLRKTGIRGLTGIKPKQGFIVRPLLFAHRKQIERYAKLKALPFNTDVTNSQIIYQRNFIRHKVLPVFDGISGNFRNQLLSSMQYLNQLERVFDAQLKQVASAVISTKGAETIINLGLLTSLVPEAGLFLLEFIRPYGFVPAVAYQVLACKDSGRKFLSHSHILVWHQNQAIIKAKAINSNHTYYIDSHTEVIDEPITLFFEAIHYTTNTQILNTPYIAMLDADAVVFPLKLRRWQPGDYFRPLGMNDFKKLSDFFVDQKLSILQKESLWLLCSNENIVWIIGHRIDDRFKLTAQTKTVLRIYAQKDIPKNAQLHATIC